MKTVTYSVPAMYADHHVLRVRAALTHVKGVEHVVASAGRKKVAVAFDEASTSADKLGQLLTEAGYPPDQAPTFPATPKQTEDGSAWYTILQRATKTEIKDREMSGDFRRY